MRVLLPACTLLGVLTWLAAGPVVGFGAMQFLLAWLAWCGPLVLLAALAGLVRPPHGSAEARLPADYLRYERRAAPRPRQF